MRMIARWAAWLLLIGGATPVAVYAIGRVVTDRFSWSQFLFWIPWWMLLMPAAVAGGAAWGLACVRRRPHEAAPRDGRWLRRMLAGMSLALVACLAHAAWHARVDRFVIPSGHGGPGPRLRIVHWTAMAPDVPPRDTTLPNLIDEHDPDLILTTMALAPHQYVGLVSKLPEGFESIQAAFFTVASRLPIRSHRHFSLGLSQNARPMPPAALADPRNPAPVPDEARHWVEYAYNAVRGPLGLPRRYFRNADPGYLVVVTLDGGERFGRPIVVHFYDLPSDPLRSKADLAEAVTRRVRGLIDSGEIAPADVMIGDFNIPRGSASLARITGSARSAFDDAGRGTFATWPRASPLLHLDHVFFGPGWRASRYERFDPGSGDHLMQVVDLRPRAGPPVSAAAQP